MRRARGLSIVHTVNGFNSRTLGRVRLDLSRALLDAHEVSIHAPWEGCDMAHAFFEGGEYVVSIHAPWEGCDLLAGGTCPRSHRFNSRTLGRVRHLITNSKIFAIECFNSRTLGRVRPELRAQYLSAEQVSIHAPWEGCDTSHASATSGQWLFQFTHPGKGATWLLPSARCASLSFNSRTLGRVRLTTPSAAPVANGFNSRTLGRVRPPCNILHWKVAEFQFTHPGKGATRSR